MVGGVDLGGGARCDVIMRLAQRIAVFLDDAAVVLPAGEADIHARLCLQEHLLDNGVLLLIEKLAHDVLPYR